MTDAPLLFRREVTVLDVDERAHELHGRIVGYDRPSRVVDTPAHSQSGDWEEYDEEFAPGSFAGQLAIRTAWPTIGLVERHGGPTAGYAVEFDDDRRDLSARFRILPRAWPDVETMFADGIRGLSAEFRPIVTREETRDGRNVRRRVRALLERVALEPVGAHVDARVLAIRSGHPSVPTPRRDDLAAFITNRRTPQ